MRQITHITKRIEPCSRYERIEDISGDWGRIPEYRAIDDIKYNRHKYYINIGNDDIEVLIASFMGRQYLRTYTTVDYLLGLPEHSSQFLH